MLKYSLFLDIFQLLRQTFSHFCFCFVFLCDFVTIDILIRLKNNDFPTLAI